MADLDTLNLNGVSHNLGGGLEVTVKSDCFVLKSGDQTAVLQTTTGTAYKKVRALSIADFEFNASMNILRGPGMVADARIEFNYSSSGSPQTYRWVSALFPSATNASEISIPATDSPRTNFDVTGWLVEPV